ncbi:MAG: YfhO family protein [Actinomycetota bacterium]
METVTRAAPSSAGAAPSAGRSTRVRRALVTVAGPALIVVAALIALRGFAFLPRLTNQHPDVLSFWLPRSCLLGDAVADGRVPLWNPFEMAGTPFAADPQSGWLSLPTMAFSWLFGCGDGLRALIVLQPILAGLGLWWFLRKEGLGRIAATAGGLSIAMAVSASSVAISLPFAGSLAWTTIALVGASGFFTARGWRRLVWLALAALAWGQVATAHLSHGLVLCTGLVAAYVLARAIREVRAGALSVRTAVLFGLGFVVFLPLANLAILIPRFALIQRSSLRAGYGALEGTVAGAIDVDRPIPEHGIWSGWPLALASTPGAYVGAAILLAVPFAFRDRARRFVVAALAAVGVVAYLLTLTLLVGAGWFRALVLALPFGDVYLHNPGRLRYVAFLVVPTLGAIGIQSLLDRRPSFAETARWAAVGIGVFGILPLLLGARPGRLLVFGIGVGATLAVAWALARRRRWAILALVGVLCTELLAGALWSSAYRGGTVYFGLEGDDHPALVHGPLRWPQVELNAYLRPGPIARVIAARDDGRYLAWIQPAAVFNKGYLFTQDEADWPALLLGRAILFGLPDALGYSPIQVPRYWSYIRATNQLPVFYNAAVIQEPSPEDVRLLGVRYLIVHEGQDELPAGISGEVIATERGYLLYELDGAQPRVSVVPTWSTVDDGVVALEAALERGFDPSATAVVEGDPGIAPADGTTPGVATYDEARPEEVRIDVAANGPSLVVVRNAWERGWEATVDGTPAPVLRADSFLQAVPVPAGEHEVRLAYREPAIGLGLLASALVWALFLGLVGAAVVTRPRGATRPAAPPGA